MLEGIPPLINDEKMVDLIDEAAANDNQNSRISLHNSAIIFDEKAVITGIKVMSKTALNFLK